jgi:hypothetical protein
MNATDNLSLEALRAIQQKRTAMARSTSTPPITRDSSKDLPKPPEKNSIEVMAFAKWFREHQKNGLLVMSKDSMLDVQPGLSATFAMGHLKRRYFVAVPDSIETWISSMPWLHVAIDPYASSLSFVCPKVSGGGVSLPPFALNFQLPYKGLAQLITNYHYLDLRTLTMLDDAKNGHKQCQIGDDIITTLSVMVTPGAKTFADLMAGPLPS